MAESGVAVSNRVATVPNLLSVVRLFGVPLFLWLVLGPHADGWAVVVLLLAGFTDWLDGKLARSLNQTSKLGQVLDPVADRLYILAVVVGLAVRDIIPVWLAVILPLRDVLLFSLVPLPADPRLQRPSGALSRQGRHGKPAVRLPAAAARRRHRRASPARRRLRLGVRHLGDRSLLVGRLLYAYQVTRIMRSPRRVPEAPS